MKPTNLNSFRLPSNRMERIVDALIDWIARHWSAIALVAVFVIWAKVSDADYREAVAKADQQRDEAQQWAAGNKVKLTLEGNPAAVADMALQASGALVK